MAAYRRVYGFRHLRANCRRRGSAPEPYARLEYRRGLPLSKTTHTTGHTVSAMLFLRAIGNRQSSSLSKAGHGGPGVISCTTISINMCVASALTQRDLRGPRIRKPTSAVVRSAMHGDCSSHSLAHSRNTANLRRSFHLRQGRQANRYGRQRSIYAVA